MNILLITSVYPSLDDKNENVTKVVRYFAQEWAKDGHTVKVVHNVHKYFTAIHALPKTIKQKIAATTSFYIPDRDAVREKSFKDGDVQVWRMPVFKFKPHGGHPDSVIRKHTNKVISMLAEDGFVPDVIIGHWMSPQVQMIARLKEVYHCRTALVLHGRGYVEDHKFNAKKYLTSVDALGCRSRAEAEYVKNALNLSKMPFICYSGVPDAFVSEWAFDEEKFSVAPEKWRFVYAGRLVGYKNIDKVLQALAAIKDQDFVFDIIGSGAEEVQLKVLAKKLGIADKVVFHGRMPREEVLSYMRKAHAFVMVSKGEVFGLVYLEAMAASCIAVGSIEEGIDGVIVDGENGLLCTPADAVALEEKLRELMSLDAVELRRYANAGFETAKKFTDSNVAKWYLDDAVNY